jgi:predicted NAD-dependent protein-ADP-ribosyltransferase YbiA (DUF1768 family)
MEFFYSKSKQGGASLGGFNCWRKKLSAFWSCSESLEIDGNLFRSIELAFHYEKFKRTDKPELGQVYIEGGQFDGDEGKGKVYSGKASMKKLGCKLDVEKWNEESVGVMKTLVYMRWKNDVEFRSIISDAKKNNIPLLHFERGTLKRPPFWGCFRSKETGEIVGQNMYGKILMWMTE